MSAKRTPSLCLAWLPLLAAALGGAGCWEEIRYTPSPAADERSASDSPAETPEALPDVTPADAADADSPANADPLEATPPAPTENADAAPVDSPAVEAPLEEKTATPHERRLAWMAASKWSLAAAAYAKGVDASQYEPMREEAVAAADELDLELPELPAVDDESQRTATVVELLRAGLGARLADAVADRFGPQAGAAARLAVGSHLLLLVYSPQDPAAASHAVALREAAQGAELPAELWRPLTELLETQAEYLPVRSAVFELHRRVEEYLGRL